MKFKFIDLFCGIGGFHQACSNLGGECIFASDIDKRAIAVYENNYGIKIHNDVKTIDENTLEDFDVLCAGFPCQPFSKCGSRGGFNDTRGTLFFDIERILIAKKPKYIVLENVVNLLHHDGGNTFKTISENLIKIGYRLTGDPLILSPHELGTPQIRKRVIIVGKHEPNNTTPLDMSISSKPLTIFVKDIINFKNNDSSLRIKPEVIKSIDAWDEFYKYYKLHPDHGARNFFLECIYGHNALNTRAVNYKKINLEYYNKHKQFIDSWVKKHDMLSKQITHQHFYLMREPKVSSLWECIIQIRANGMVFTQTDIMPTLTKSGSAPIYGPCRRLISSDEYRILQDFPKSFILDENAKAAYNQFGNAVNVKVIEKVLVELFKT